MNEVDKITGKELETIAEKKSVSREIFEWVMCFIAAFVVAALIRYFLFTSVSAWTS